MRRLHLLRRAGDTLALEVIEHQLDAGDEVHVVLLGEALGAEMPDRVAVLSVPPLAYDAVVAELEWCEGVISW